MKRNKPISGYQGFSLLEVIFALGIAAISVSSLVIFFTYSIQTIRISRSIAEATTLAQRTMEELKAEPDKILDLADNATPGAPQTVAEVIYEPDSLTIASKRQPVLFKITTTAQRMPATGNRVIDIVVRVDWQYQSPIKGPSAPKDNKSVVLESYYISEN